MRLIFVPALLVLANLTAAQIATVSVASFTAAFVAHASAAELWIRLTRRSAVTGVGAAETV
jgi:hypothetical protein